MANTVRYSRLQLLAGITALGSLVRLIVWWYYSSHLHALVIAKLPDDALYYFTAASSLAQGHGITSDGIHATNGMHPLWLFTITPLFLLGLGKWTAIHSVLLFQTVIDCVVLWLIGSTIFDHLSEATDTDRSIAAASAQLIYALSPIVLIQSINGLETTLTAFLLVLWLRECIQAMRGTHKGAMLGIVSGLLLLARTDSFIILLPVVLWLAYTRAVSTRAIAIASSIAILIVSPWLLWNMHTFGTPLQSSAQAVPFFAMKKFDVMYGGSTYLHLGLDAVRNVVKPFVYSASGISLLTIAYLLLKQRARITTLHYVVFLMMLGAILLLAIHTLFRGFIREWYVEQLIPVFLVGFGVSLGLLHEMSSRIKIALAILALLPLFAIVTPHFRSQSDVVFRGVPLAQQLTARSKIASLNSGYYSYFAAQDGKIVNMDGVVNHEAYEHITRGDLGDYLVRDSVDYVLDFAGDLGGYVGLIDHDLLRAFAIDSTIKTSDPANPLLLYRRSGRPGGSGNASH